MHLKSFLLGLFIISMFNFFQLSFLIPSPVLYLFLSQGKKQGRVFYFLAAGITLLFSYFNDSFIVPAFFMTLSILLAELTFFTRDAEKLIKYSFVFSVILYLIVYVVVFVYKSSTIEAVLLEYYQKNVFPYFNEIYKNNSALLKETELFFNRVIPYISGIINATILLSIWLNVYIIHKRYPDLIVSNDLSKWYLPDNIIWIPIFGLALISSTLVYDLELLNKIGLDIIIIIAVLFFLQGISVISFFMKKMNIFTGFHGLIYILIVLYLNLFVLVIGFIDFWIDFRKVKNSQAEIEKK